MRGERLNAPGILRLLRTDGGGSERFSPFSERGRRLRNLRHEHGHSLQGAAQLAGLSPSFLSALERGSTGASVATLHRLAQLYGVTVPALLASVAPARRRVRPTERQQLSVGKGVRIEQLSMGATHLEPQLFVLAASASSEGAYAHEGEEFLYVLDGGLTFWIGDEERYRLKAGDALTFPSTLPHRWRNRADGETRLLWINTPPTF
jgi:transcriptional regulator with XRE-family HTH domain